MFAKEIMNEFFVVVRPTTTVAQAAELMKNECVGLVCVCNEDREPLGVITDRDIVVRVCAARLDPQDTEVQDFMTTDLLRCGPLDPMSEVEATMTQRGIGRVLVVSEERCLVGVITLAEIWHHESPFAAGAVSRQITSREFRMVSSSGAAPAIWPAANE